MKYLILDAHYLCHRAYHTTGELSYEGVKTGVVYGFLRDVVNLQMQHRPSHTIFCFDSSKSIRKQILPEYKENRKGKEEMTDDEWHVWSQFRKQITKLRKAYLPLIGYKNVFLQRGYEADDLIAAICTTKRGTTEAIVVTADNDMIQLVNGSVSLWHPQKKQYTTPYSVWQRYEATPEIWPHVKAIAGCVSDNVPGVPGVAEKTAIKYLNGSLGKNTKAYHKIKQNEELWRQNLDLVRLPLSGCGIPKIRDDELSEEGFKKVCKHLGIQSLRNPLQGLIR